MTLNSRLHFLQSVVGSYKLDVRFVYDQPSKYYSQEQMFISIKNLIYSSNIFYTSFSEAKGLLLIFTTLLLDC